MMSLYFCVSIRMYIYIYKKMIYTYLYIYMLYMYVCVDMWDIWNMKAADESMCYKYDAVLCVQVVGLGSWKCLYNGQNLLHRWGMSDELHRIHGQEHYSGVPCLYQV